MLGEVDFRKWAVWGLLIVHIAWIGNHMRLIASDQINPWRMGGYAMYTVPNLAQRTRVFDANMPDAPLLVNMLRYEKATRFTNYGRTFRCANVPASALLAFLEENQTLVGRNLVFVYSEREFVRAPPAAKRVNKGMVFLTWQNEHTFTYTNRFCGREEISTATLPESLSVPSPEAPSMPDVPSVKLP
jgi:hypothetical protein